MSLELSKTPEWEIEHLRMELTRQVMDRLDSDDRQRLKSLDCAHYVPPDITAAEAVADMPPGGVVQVAGYICRRGDATTGRAFRTLVPRLLKWGDIPKVAQALVQQLARAFGDMDREPLH